MNRLIVAAAAFVALALPAVAHHDGEVVQKAGIIASHAHIEQPVAATSHGFHVYLTIENTGAADDRLIAAKAPIAATGRFEANLMGADGALEVRTVPAVVVRAGQTITMQPGALRIAFDDVRQPLEAGAHFVLTLTFENAGTLQMVGEVEAGDDHGYHDDEPQS